MAMPLGIFSTFCAAGTPSLAKSPSSSLMLVQPYPLHHPKLRTLVAYATASDPATETKKRAPRGFSKPRPVSPEMKDFLGGRTEIPRTEVLKDPANERVIVCDEKLKKIFGERDQVGFLEIAGLITPHFRKLEN